MIKSYFLRLFLLSAGIGLRAFLSAETPDPVQQAVVKVYMVKSDFNYLQPWQRKIPVEGSGSGVIIAGKYILTNAHLASNTTFLQVQKNGSPRKYIASVKWKADAADLALLTVNDPSFFEGTRSLELGAFPKVRDKISVYGFPLGGERLSITEGVVSRIESTIYSHSNAKLLAVQIDAAINPGNSGGPAVKDGKIVGIAFQSNKNGENLGYIIPTVVIRHFLSDIEDHIYNGYPELGFIWQSMENPSMRKYYKMAPDQTGILITKIWETSGLNDFLKPDDILLDIDGHPIANDGSVSLENSQRADFEYLVQLKQLNESVQIRLLRRGKILQEKLPLLTPINSSYLIPRKTYDIPPSYYIYGGFIFEPLTENLINGISKRYYTPATLMYHYFNGVKTKEQKELVVLVKSLPGAVNSGYRSSPGSVITRANGKKINKMRDLISALEENKKPFDVLEGENGLKIILEKDTLKRETRKIFRRYQIPSDRSRNLLLQTDLSEKTKKTEKN